MPCPAADAARSLRSVCGEQLRSAPDDGADDGCADEKLAEGNALLRRGRRDRKNRPRRGARPLNVHPVGFHSGVQTVAFARARMRSRKFFLVISATFATSGLPA